jgi:hypothetical protein
MTQGGSLVMGGELGTRLNKGGYQLAPLTWRMKNALRPAFWGGWLANRAAQILSELTGIPTLTAELSIILNKADGTRINYGVVGYRVVTTAFVTYVVDQLQTETSTFGDFKYHDSGVGTTNENVTDTAIETTDGENRVSGTQTEASATVYQSVGTITYTTTLALTEHGLFNASTSGTLMDRTEFAAINVVNTDSVTYTYSLTISAGG